MSVLNFMFELDGNSKEKEVDVNKPIDDKEELDELKKLNRKEIVGSKFVNTNVNATDTLIANNKLNNDPLYLLQKKQIHERNKILLNQYKMKQIRRKLKNDKAKQEDTKKKRKRKKQRKKDKKLKQLLLQSLDNKSRSRSRSPSRSRSRSRNRHRRDRRQRRHSHNDRKDRDYHNDYDSDSNEIAMEYESNTRIAKKKSKKYGLILNENKKCGVKIDKHAMDNYRYDEKNKSKEIDRNSYGKNAQCVDDKEILQQMMDTAEEYDKYQRHKHKKSQRYEKCERENAVEKDGKFLSEMGTKLYLHHSDTLQSRLNKNVSTLLKRNRL